MNNHIQKVKEEVTEMRKDILELEETDRYYMKKYNYIYTKTPALFKMVYENKLSPSTFDMQLEFMFNRATDISGNVKTQKEGDTEVYENLNKTYIEPLLKK